MLERFKNFIAANVLIKEGDRILLAVSGGMDSTVMLDLCKKAGLEFGIAHCNFSLRGQESDQDEFFVRQLADKMNVNFYYKRFDTKVFADKLGMSVQMTARKLRYDWFEHLLKTESYYGLALAHHLDDQVETLFINLLRGTGLAGLHGIPVIQHKIIRPMMFAYRREIEQYAHSNGISYRNDSSNDETKYIRNKIRLQILPVLEEINPECRKIINENIKRFKGAEVIYLEKIKAAWNHIRLYKNKQYLLPLESLNKLSNLETYLYEWLSDFGFNAAMVGDIRESLKDISGKQFMSSSHRLLRDRKYLVIEEIRKNSPKNSKTEDQQSFLVKAEDDLLEVPFKMAIRIIKNSTTFTIPSNSGIASFDFSKLQFPLVMRKWKRGDYFHPFGMQNKKKLSDFFIDQKFSLFDKEKTWLLCSGKDIIWIIGHRIDNNYRVHKDTEQIYEMQLL